MLILYLIAISISNLNSEKRTCIEMHTFIFGILVFPQMFGRCQRLVQQIGAKSRGGSTQEQRLTINITSSLARTVTELSTNFRKSQSDYLKSEYHATK